MTAPGGKEFEHEATVQITRIIRPLLSVAHMVKNGDITVVCKRDEAVVFNAQSSRLPSSRGKVTSTLRI